MDKKTWLILTCIYLATWGLMYTLSLVVGRMGGLHYFMSVFFSTWIPGCIGLISARIERFKISIFGEPSWFVFFSFLIAWLLGICLNYRPDPYLETHGFLDLVILYPFLVGLIGLPSALGGLIFWWGYLHKKLEKTAPLANMLIIGIVWGLWYAPLILFEEYHYAKHPLGGVVMMPLFTIVLSPLMLYFKHKGRGILIPAIFFATLHISATFRSKFHWNYGNDLIDGVTGIKGIIVLFFCSCVALILLWKQGALNTQAKQPVENDVKMVG